MSPRFPFICPPAAANEEIDLSAASEHATLYSSYALQASEKEAVDIINGCEALSVLIAATEKTLDGAEDCLVTTAMLRWGIERMQQQLWELVEGLRPRPVSQIGWISPQKVS